MRGCGKNYYIVDQYSVECQKCIDCLEVGALVKGNVSNNSNTGCISLQTETLHTNLMYILFRRIQSDYTPDTRLLIRVSVVVYHLQKFKKNRGVMVNY